MEKMQIREVLTYDKHFEQAGFIALLREWFFTGIEGTLNHED